ncbi:MAG: hypothetical protein CL579_15865 [Alteromonadaceae bacterium]|nr:hypothetical protein [Alteromonadaceae bacterium]MBB20788.1 hypothetical protein [Rickettsiales bacterium]
MTYIKRMLARAAIFTVIAGGIFVAGFLWLEAKKEMVYLCGTFAQGESINSVISQLETGEFLQYSVFHIEGATHIVATSDAPFFGYACVIEFDGQATVQKASIVKQ